MAWHPSSHGTGCGLKVVWKHHPPADPMKVPQTAARGFCRGFVFVRTAAAQKKCSTALRICGRLRGKGIGLMCYLLNMLRISDDMRE